MDKTKKNARVIVAVILAAFVVACAVRIIFINQKFETPEQRQYGMREAINYNGLEISVLDAYFMQTDDIKLFFLDSLDQGNDIKSIVTEIKMENKTREKLPMGYFYLFTIETAAYSNGNDLSALETINDPSIFQEFIEPGECVTIKVPFEIWSSAFKSDTWEQLESKTFYLTTALHPSVIRVKLKL